MYYSDKFKNRMISRLTGPDKITANSLSQEAGVPQTTLSRWLRKAGTIDTMGNESKSSPPQSPREWSIEKKLRVVQGAMSLSDAELGEFLRREGLHEAHLEEMQLAIKDALGTQKKKNSKKRSPEAKRIKELEKELARKDKALAEVTALLVLKKNWRIISWGTRTTTLQRRAKND